MNSFCDELFTGTAFTLYQNGRFGGCYKMDRLEHLVHDFTLSDNVGIAEFVLELLPQPEILIDEPAKFECLVDHQFDLIAGERLRDVIESTFLHSLHSTGDCAVAGHHDDRGVVIPLLRLL